MESNPDRIEIHRNGGAVHVDVSLPRTEESAAALESIHAIVEALGHFGLEALYPNEFPVTLSIFCDERRFGYSVRGEDGVEVEADNHGLSRLADRMEGALDTGLLIFTP